MPGRIPIKVLVVVCLALWLAVDCVQAARIYRPVHSDPAMEAWRWRSFPELEGLGLRCLVEAKDGAVWFGTDEGVRRYDGLHWTVYTHADGLYGTPVEALCVSRDGSVYTGARSGISRFKDGVFRRVFPPKGDLPWGVRRLVEASDGSLWAGTVWGALHMDQKGWTLYTSEQMRTALRHLTPYLRVLAVAEEGIPARRWPKGIGAAIAGHVGAHQGGLAGVLWFLAPGGPAEAAGLKIGDRIVAVDDQPGASQDQLSGPVGIPVRLTVQREGHPGVLEIEVVHRDVEGHYHNFSVFDVYEDRDGAVWFGLSEGEIVHRGIRGARPDSAQIWTVYTIGDGLDVGRRPRIQQTRDGAIWVVSDDRQAGVNRFDGNAWTHVRLSRLGGIDVNPSILETADGTLWVGGHWGIMHAFRNGSWFIYKAHELPIPGARILDLMQSADDAVWFAGAGQEVSRLDAGTAVWTTYEGLRYQCETSEGSLWFVSDDHGVVRFDGASWTRYGSEDGLMASPHSLLAAADGSVWAAGSHKAMAATARFMCSESKAEGQTRWSLQTHPMLSHSIRPDAVFQASDGCLWFGAETDSPTEWGCLGGALQLSRETWTHHIPPDAPRAPYGIGETAHGILWFGGDRLRRFDGRVWTTIAKPKELTAPFVDVVYTAPGGDLWVGTRAYGVFHYDGETWVQYDVRHGLADDLITGITQTLDGSVWAVTGKGVSRFDGWKWYTHTLPGDLALRVSEIRQSRDGAIWLNLTDRRAVRYAPDVFPPETEITVSLDRVFQPGDIALSWRGADVWGETPEDQLQYSYRLDGGDWTRFSPEKTHIFPELASGDHTFEVRARDRDFHADPTPAVLQFSVVPPVWQQPWFVGLLAVLISAVGFQSVRVIQRDRRLMAANAALQNAHDELEQRVARRTVELRAINEQLGREAIERREAEKALGETLEQVLAGRERLQTLSRRLVEVQEVERQRLARELHDEIGQLLTGLKLSLEISTRLPVDAGRTRLGEAQALVNDLIAQVRNLSLDLRPAMLDDLGLLSALLWHFERYTTQTKIHVTFHHSGLEGQRFPPEVETAAYRIVQEALTNVARHADVDEVAVRIWVFQGALNIQVEDQGKGFNPEAALAASSSGGLSGMHERAVLLSGQLAVESAPGAGSFLMAELPLTVFPGGEEGRGAYDDNRTGG